MSYTPHLKRGGELYHWRPKGSRNGYSNDPNYTPGPKAKGQLINGRYVYDNKLGGAGKSMGVTRPVTLSKPQKKQNIFQRAASGARSAGNWLADRGGKAVNAAGKAASSAGQAIGKGVSRAAKDTSKWVGDRANDVGKGVSKAGKSIGKAANSAKEWAVGGNKERENAMRNEVLAKQSNKSRTIGGSFSGESLKKHNISGREAREEQQEKANKTNAYANRSAKSLQKYRNSASGMINNTKNTLKGYSKSGREEIDKHGDKVFNKYDPKNIKEWFTGERYKKGSESFKRLSNDSKELANQKKEYYKSKNGKSVAAKEYNLENEFAGDADRKSKLLNDQYENAPAQKLKKADKSISKTASDVGKGVSKAAKDTWNFVKPGGDLDKAAIGAGKAIGKGVSKGFGDAKNFVEKTASNVGKTASKTASDIGKGASKLANDAGKSISKTASDVGKGASKAAGDAKEFVSNLLSGKKNEKKESSKSNKPIRNKSIETKSIETKPIETKTKIDYEKDEKNGIVRRYDGKVNSYLSTSSKRTNKYGSGNAAARNYQKDWERGESYIDAREKKQKQGDKIRANNKAKKSSNANPKVSKEYEEEMAYNSRKNNYYGFTTDTINSIDGGKGTFTYDQSRGETVYIDKNGKKHYAK